jgi:hypothetical protein
MLRQSSHVFPEDLADASAGQWPIDTDLLTDGVPIQSAMDGSTADAAPFQQSPTLPSPPAVSVLSSEVADTPASSYAAVPPNASTGAFGSSSTTLTLSQIQSFVYMAGTQGSAQILQSSSAQLFIVAGSGERIGNQFDRSNIDPGHNKLVVNYINATETGSWSTPCRPLQIAPFFACGPEKGDISERQLMAQSSRSYAICIPDASVDEET